MVRLTRLCLPNEIVNPAVLKQENPADQRSFTVSAVATCSGSPCQPRRRAQRIASSSKSIIQTYTSSRRGTRHRSVRDELPAACSVGSSPGASSDMCIERAAVASCYCHINDACTFFVKSSRDESSPKHKNTSISISCGQSLTHVCSDSVVFIPTKQYSCVRSTSYHVYNTRDSRQTLLDSVVYVYVHVHVYVYTCMHL